MMEEERRNMLQFDLQLNYDYDILYGMRERKDNEGFSVHTDSYNNYFGNGLHFYRKYLSMKIKEQ